jgi:hypothetical protein
MDRTKMCPPRGRGLASTWSGHSLTARRPSHASHEEGPSSWSRLGLLVYGSLPDDTEGWSPSHPSPSLMWRRASPHRIHGAHGLRRELRVLVYKPRMGRILPACSIVLEP